MTGTSESDAHPIGWEVLAAVAGCIGVLLRLGEYFARPALWIDEAMLGASVLSRPCGLLTTDLYFDQAVGPIYLCLVRVVASPFGGSELGLRLPSLIAGIALLAVTWQLGRRLFGEQAGAWATLLVAMSPLAVAYSNEAKPYIVDALVTATLALVMLRMLPLSARHRDTLALIGLGWLAILTSLTAPFILAAIGVVMWIEGVRGRSKARAWQAVFASAAWLLGFLFVYHNVYRPDESAAFLATFWADSFLQLGAGSKASLVNAVSSMAAGLPIPLWFDRARFLVPVGVLGAVLAVRAGGARAAGVLLIPCALVLVAAALGLYPMAQRLLLFALPLTALIVAGGASRLLQRLPFSGALSRLAFVAAGGAALLMHGEMLERKVPVAVRDARDAVAAVEDLVQTEPILITAHLVPEWLYYSTDWRSFDPLRVQWFGAAPSLQSGVHNAAGTSPPDPPLQLWDPGTAGRVELLPSPSGVGLRPDGRSETVFAGWGEAQVAQLLRLQLPVIWVYSDSRSEGDVLSEAWRQEGGLVSIWNITGNRRLLRFHRAEATSTS